MLGIRQAERIVRGLLRCLPPRVARKIFDTVASAQPESYKLTHGTVTMFGSIENIKKAGFWPASIIDVGAYVGDWTRGIHAIYPDVPILMIEANPERTSSLAEVTREVECARYHIGLLGTTNADAVPFHVVAGGAGSSMLPEQTGFPRTVTQVPMTTLDHVVGSSKLGGPYFLKMDVGGYELEVLRGGLTALGNTEVALMEVAFMEYNEGAPLFAEVVAFMKSRGFVVYDICGQVRRESDSALFQTDLMFVRENSHLRDRRKFWNRES